jgi:uncharacterized membrane protein YgdD (TMEM256/DUF423 family)
MNQTQTTKTLTATGAICAFLGVALGAFGAHGLKAVIPADRLAVYHTGVDYHLVHALAILLVAALADRLSNERLVRAVGWLFTSGIVIFSGSLYALAITNVKILGAITPLGGVCFLSGWALLAAATLRISQNSDSEPS